VVNHAAVHKPIQENKDNDDESETEDAPTGVASASASAPAATAAAAPTTTDSALAAANPGGLPGFIHRNVPIYHQRQLLSLLSTKSL
jgi:hypothetical protein